MKNSNLYWILKLHSLKAENVKQFSERGYKSVNHIVRCNNLAGLDPSILCWGDDILIINNEITSKTPDKINQRQLIWGTLSTCTNSQRLPQKSGAPYLVHRPRPLGNKTSGTMRWHAQLHEKNECQLTSARPSNVLRKLVLYAMIML